MRPDLKTKKDKSILAYARELDKLRKISWDNLLDFRQIIGMIQE